jgi:hypothetical protein
MHTIAHELPMKANSCVRVFRLAALLCLDALSQLVFKVFESRLRDHRNFEACEKLSRAGRPFIGNLGLHRARNAWPAQMVV